MATIRRVVLASIISIPCLYAADRPSLFHSKFEVQQHLFGNTRSVVQRESGSAESLMQDESAVSKSVGLAAMYSLLLPGMGELYAEGFGSGKYFLIAEGVLWLTYATFEVYGNSLRDDARAYAASHAGFITAGKGDQFFVDVGNFINISDYNEKKLRDREPDKIYDANAGYAWQWESDAARSAFRDQRIASENMYNNRRFVIGAILINHVASAINAARSAISRNKEIEAQGGDTQVKADVWGGWEHPHGIIVTVTRTF